jgi:2-polyprenyl-6-methoxyphenol hydroxylase-like FAD-dependent oxidoreductase
MVDVADVVVVGGGIGGASLAFALARAGLGVTVLEASQQYEDRVRGESMQAWGVKEARELGVEEVMLAAGAHISPVWKQYGEEIEGAAEIPMALMVEGIPGSLNLRHPVACQALVDAAADAGATVVRGVRDVKLTSGPSPTVSFGANGAMHELTTSLVVGADGRASTVRKQVGITLERQEAISYIAGLLVDGLIDVPDDHDVLAGEGDLLFVMFHQGGGRARVYLCPGQSGQHRFSGRQGTERFLAACAISSYPWSGQVASGTPAGPIATYPGDDTWTATPYDNGVVLIGDAAGHNDPIIGQGLSIALRDARIVRDLVVDGARSSEGFSPYGQERLNRMARVRFIADVLAVTHAEDADNRAARRAFVGEKMAAMDPEFFTVLVGASAGPETVPAEFINPELLERIRAA